MTEHLAGTAPWTAHEREAKIEVPSVRMRGNQDYSTMHLGRGTRWHKPVKR
jgi:hypothetical protein